MSDILRRTALPKISAWMLAAATLAAVTLLPGSPAMAETTAAAIELHNRTDTFLPRVDSYSEQAFNRFFNRHTKTRFLSRTAVSEMLLRQRDRVVLFPDDPVLAASFGHDLGVDYVVTGTILDYETDGTTHRMMVELMVIGVEEQDYVLRKVYDGEARDTSGYKQHREILDQIIEDVAADFESYLSHAEDIDPPAAEPSL